MKFSYIFGKNNARSLLAENYSMLIDMFIGCPHHHFANPFWQMMINEIIIFLARIMQGHSLLKIIPCWSICFLVALTTTLQTLWLIIIIIIVIIIIIIAVIIISIKARARYLWTLSLCYQRSLHHIHHRRHHHRRPHHHHRHYHR